MRAVEIINPGAHTTIQDLGRNGFRDAGVPASGPLDHISLRFANTLAGNHVNTPALEMLMLGPTVKVLADSVRVALVGCEANIPSGQSVRLGRGDVFRVLPLGNNSV